MTKTSIASPCPLPQSAHNDLLFNFPGDKRPLYPLLDQVVALRDHLEKEISAQSADLEHARAKLAQAQAMASTIVSWLNA